MLCVLWVCCSVCYVVMERRPTSRVELHKLQVLQGQADAGGHGVTVTSAGVGRGGGEVGASVTTGGQDGLVGLWGKRHNRNKGWASSCL